MVLNRLSPSLAMLLREPFRVILPLLNLVVTVVRLLDMTCRSSAIFPLPFAESQHTCLHHHLRRCAVHILLEPCDMISNPSIMSGVVASSYLPTTSWRMSYVCVLCVDGIARRGITVIEYDAVRNVPSRRSVVAE